MNDNNNDTNDTTTDILNATTITTIINNHNSNSNDKKVNSILVACHHLYYQGQVLYLENLLLAADIKYCITILLLETALTMMMIDNNGNDDDDTDDRYQYAKKLKAICLINIAMTRVMRNNKNVDSNMIYDQYDSMTLTLSSSLDLAKAALLLYNDVGLRIKKILILEKTGKIVEALDDINSLTNDAHSVDSTTSTPGTYSTPSIHSSSSMKYMISNDISVYHDDDTIFSQRYLLSGYEIPLQMIDSTNDMTSVNQEKLDAFLIRMKRKLQYKLTLI